MTDQTTLTPDQALAMKTAARHLKDEFSGVFGVETIENFLTTSYDQFAGRANISNFLPLLAERFARQRLHALAKVEGKASSGVPIVLFLCVHNAGRSQIALGWFNHLAGEKAIGVERRLGAGRRDEPGGGRGHGRGRHRHRQGVLQAVDRGDRAGRRRRDTMGCGDACPIFPGKRYEDWDLEDPAGLGVEAVRPIRDEIEQRVRGLLEELGVTV